MNRVTAFFIVFGILFLIIFLFDYYLVNKKYIKRVNNKKKKNEDHMELSYLIIKFNLDKEKIPINRLLIFISLINAFIISIVSTTLLVLKMNMILKFLIGFVLLISLIYSIYELLGRYLVKKGWTKNGK